MNKTTNLTRRRFLSATAATAAGLTVVPRHVLGGPGHVPPSETVLVGVVGCGGQGRVNTQNLLRQPDVKIIAVADPREQADYSRFYFRGVAGRLPVKAIIEKHYGQADPSYRCRDYVDFRKMLDQEKDLDAVVCATPDHWHAFVSMAAIRRGKHVYCEKPLTHNVYEARMLGQAARQARVVTQMGNQGRSSRSHAMACQMLWDGALGAVREVHVWSGAGGWIDHRGRPAQAQPVPEGLDWQLWLGPRPDRPYHIEYCPYTWRGWWAFGCGAVGDMMIHNMDPAFAGLDLDKRHPASVQCLQSRFVDEEVIGPDNHIVWEYPAENGRPALTVHWYDGQLRPQVQGVEGLRKFGGNGILILGDEAAMQGGGWSRGLRIIPEEKNRAYLQAHQGKTSPRTLTPASSHHRDWLDAIKNGRKALSCFEYGARLTEMVLLGNVAVRAGRKILWDGPNMKVTNCPEAQQFVRESYRPGFDLAKI